MKSSRFFTQSRKIFGTSLLQMNPNTIKRLCRSSKYHFSIRDHQSKIAIFDSITNQITTNISTGGMNTMNDLTTDLETNGLSLTELNIEINGLREVLANGRSPIGLNCLTEIRNLSTMGMDTKIVSSICCN